LVLLWCGLAANGFCADEETPPGKIVFLPFTIHTNQARQYLQDGLTDILATRLTSRTGLIAVHRTKETKKLAQLMRQGNQAEFKDILANLRADFLVLGSLDQQPAGYEIMVYVFDRKKGSPASFSKNIPDLSKTIPAMDDISIEIAGAVFNKNKTVQLAPTNPQEEGMSGFQTAHPDRAYREGLYQPASILGLDGDMYKVLSSRKSNKINAAVRAMDVGDLDGDGREEIILAEPGNLSIYRFAADHFQHVADQDFPGHLAAHAIRLADMDGNGRMEIYITANNGDKPASRVYEWDGTAFHLLYADVPFYLRPGIDPQGKPVLLGQSNSATGPAGDKFHVLVPSSDNTLVSSETIPVPQGFNLLDFIRADLDGNGTLEFIGITTKNRLVVLNPAGETLWTSEAGYGASRDFLGTLTSNRAGGRTPIYMHTRIVTRDMNGDGKLELIVGRNRLANVKFFKRLRYFEGSSISALNWDGSEMTTLWETKKTTGYTTDYQAITDKNTPDRLQLFFVESSSSYPLFFWEDEKSVLHLYTMGKNSSM
jgi:TolB-like protein